jgi:hypothetical protein
MTPDSGKTVLRSRVGRNYRPLPTSGRYARAACCAEIICQHYIESAREPDLAPRLIFFSRWLSFRRLLLGDWAPGGQGSQCRQAKLVGVVVSTQIPSDPERETMGISSSVTESCHRILLTPPLNADSRQRCPRPGADSAARRSYTHSRLIEGEIGWPAKTVKQPALRACHPKEAFRSPRRGAIRSGQ